MIDETDLRLLLKQMLTADYSLPTTPEQLIQILSIEKQVRSLLLQDSQFYVNLCRSSTLSSPVEVYGRQAAGVAGFTFDSNSAPVDYDEAIEPITSDGAETTCQTSTNADDQPGNSHSSLLACSNEVEPAETLFDRGRRHDQALLERLGVVYICDLMLEHRKAKMWIPVTSSEKAEPANSRYRSLFRLLSMPFPGSEFFSQWHLANCPMQGLHFDWSKPKVDAEIKPDLMPSTRISADVNWNEYRSWDLTELTSNYLKLFLGLLYEGSGGCLIHCVSGWDRTPLFVSLLRCLLWADDLLHNDLNMTDLAYLTLAYDWFLFGHKLVKRQQLGEQVLLYAFDFLASAADRDDLSLHSFYPITTNHQPTTEGSSDTVVISNSSQASNSDSDSFEDLRSPDQLVQDRRVKLTRLAALLKATWIELIRPELTTPTSQASLSETLSTKAVQLTSFVSTLVTSFANGALATTNEPPELANDEGCDSTTDMQ